jgi:hypothetical protein
MTSRSLFQEASQVRDDRDDEPLLGEDGGGLLGEDGGGLLGEDGGGLLGEEDGGLLGEEDERLLAELRAALRARQAVPDWFVETGKSAYAWHNIDAELAQLTYDSDSDADRMAVTRSESASIRALTFTSPDLSIELEVSEDSLFGRFIPPRGGTLEVHTTAGVASSPVDEIGCFVVEPIPASPFRLRCRTEDGTDVLTGWITL